jgi:Uma2 family endonuclease
MVAQSLRWTTRDLEALSNDGDWTRHEIIDGEHFVTRAPHIRHQSVASKINVRLGNWSERTGLGSTVQTPGVIFTETDAVIPDLVWISRERLDSGVDEAGHLIVPPELMVEVLSSGGVNEQRDREIKLKLYSRYGVQEYWIVNWKIKSLEVYRRSAAQLELVETLWVGDRLISPLLPEFEMAIGEVFE